MSANIKNLIYMSSVQVANYIFPLITIPIVSRAFGPEKIGLVNYIAAIVGYFTLFVNYSFNYTGVRWLTRKPEDKNILFWGVFLVQLIIFIMSCSFFYLLVYSLPEAKGVEGYYWLSFLSCLAALFTQNWFLQAYSDFKRIALFSVLTKLISFIFILSIVKSSSDLMYYIMIVNVTSLASSFLVFIYIIIKYKIRFLIPGYEIIKKLVSDGKHLFLSSIVTNIYTTTGIVLLGTLSTSLDVGYYTSAQKLMDVSKAIILMPISQILFPILSRKFSEHKDVGINAVKKILPVFVLISICFLIFINLFRSLLVRVLFGENFMPILPMISILSLGVFAVFYGVFIGGQVMLNLGMDKAFLNIQVYIAIFSLSVNFLLIRFGGGLITSTVWTTSEIIISLYQILYLHKRGITIFSWRVLSLKSLMESFKYVLRKK